jgi:cation:H+ antiporter
VIRVIPVGAAAVARAASDAARMAMQKGGVVLTVAAFAAGAAVSLLMSWLLVSRLERIGERLGLSEALLGMVAALAADAPEITAAIAALASHQQRIGAGVVLGSNVFSLAALLGLGGVVAGRIGQHRRVVALTGTVAIWVAVVCTLVVLGAVPPLTGLALAAAGLAMYLAVLGRRGQGMRLPARWRAWLQSAVAEEELELEEAIRPRRGRWSDAAAAATALIVVIIASITMERAASSLGRSLGVPEIITGGLVLAAVTSLPNAVAAVYLASRGRGAATLSTALNSNTLNITAGLLLPGATLGLGAPSRQALLVTAWYGAFTLAVLALAWRHQGLGRLEGAAIITGYAAFTASLIISGYAKPDGTALVVGLSVLPAVPLAAAVTQRGRGRQRNLADPAPPSLNGQRAAGCMTSGAESSRTSLLPGWTARRLWAASVIAVSAVAAIDAATGHRVILIGLLVVGPCIALLTGRWLLASITGAWACGLAVLLGVPDRIWATSTHLAFISATTIVAAAAAAGAAIIDRVGRRPRSGPGPR